MAVDQNEIVRNEPNVLACAIENCRKAGRPGSSEVEDSVVVFADLAASTEISERMSDRGFLEFVLDHNNTLILAFSSKGGRLIKEVGDEVMMCFEKDVANGPPAMRAVLGAVLAQRTFEKLNKRRRKALAQFRTKIGIALVRNAEKLGRSGSTEKNVQVCSKDVKCSPDLIGFGVNRAARVASVAKPGQIIIDEAAVRTLSKRHLDALGKNSINIPKDGNREEYTKLKGVTGEKVTVREVIFHDDGKGLGLAPEDKIESLALIDLAHIGGDRVKRAAEELKKKVFSGGKYHGKLRYALPLIGHRSVVVRLKAFDLEEHKEIMTRVLAEMPGAKTNPSLMAHSFFIYGPHPNPADSITDVACLLLFGLHAGEADKMALFLRTLEKRVRDSDVEVHDSGLLFGEFEAFVILKGQAQKLAKVLSSKPWTHVPYHPNKKRYADPPGDLDGVSVRRYELHPVAIGRLRLTVPRKTAKA